MSVGALVPWVLVGEAFVRQAQTHSGERSKGWFPVGFISSQPELAALKTYVSDCLHFQKTTVKAGWNHMLGNTPSKRHRCG